MDRKSALAIALVLPLSFSLLACSGSGDTSPQKTGGSTISSDPQNPPPLAAVPEDWENHARTYEVTLRAYQADGLSALTSPSTLANTTAAAYAKYHQARTVRMIYFGLPEPAVGMENTFARDFGYQNYSSYRAAWKSGPLKAMEKLRGDSAASAEEKAGLLEKSLEGFSPKMAEIIEFFEEHGFSYALVLMELDSIRSTVQSD